MKYIVILAALFAVSCAGKKKNMDVAEVKKAPVVRTELKSLVKSNNSEEYSCLVQKDLRKVSIKRTKGRCEVSYLKYGETQKVAWAEATPSICSKVFGSIRTNIEGAGFKCNQ